MKAMVMEFKAQVDNLPVMLGFVTEHAARAGVKGERLGKVELAIEEALVNIIHHAFTEVGADGNKVQLECEFVPPGRFMVTIRDKGVAFNPCKKVVDPQTDVPIEQRAIGGLGIYLIRQLVDEMHYDRLDEENVLTLIFDAKS